MIKLKNILKEGVVDISLHEERLIDMCLDSFKKTTQPLIDKKKSALTVLSVCRAWAELFPMKNNNYLNFKLEFVFRERSNTSASYDIEDNMITINLAHSVETNVPIINKVKAFFNIILMGDYNREDIFNEWGIKYIKIKSIDYDSIKKGLYHEYVHKKQNELFKKKTGKDYSIKDYDKYLKNYDVDPKELSAKAYELFLILKKLENISLDNKGSSSFIESNDIDKMIHSLKRFSPIDYNGIKKKYPKAYKRLMKYLYKYVEKYKEKNAFQKKVNLMFK